ncbi:MAG: ABC transporter ATP-binding protein [Thermoguttaceae bacterium]|nr:ABC transporter ATP-binding protein [Thermoguttaceae bacterium]
MKSTDARLINESAALEKRMKERETLVWLVAQFRSTFALLVVASLGQTVLSGLGVYGAFCSRDVIDAATTGSRERFWLAAIILLAAITLSIGVSLFNQAIAERLRARAGVALQRRGFSTLMRKDFEATTSRHSGDAINRLTSDVKVVTDGASTIVPSLVSMVTRLVFAFVALCYFDWKLAAFFAASGVFVFCGTMFFRKRIKELHKAMQAAEGRKRSFWHEALNNLLVVKAFSRETEMETRSDELLEAHYKATMKRRNFSLIAGGGMNVFFSLSYFGALVWQAYQILLGASTFGSTIAVLQLIGNVQSPFAGLSGLLPRYYNAIASAERLRELENMPDEGGSDVERLDGSALYDELEAIVFDDVTFRYMRDDKEIEVFKNASFELPKGKSVVVSGRSGIGKSTLFKLLVGVCKPNSGRIYLRTRSGEIPVDRRTRALFAFVPQGNMLFSGTVAENLSFFRSGVDPEQMREAAKDARAEFVDELANGFDSALGEKGAGLSEGQIQRLAIARAALADAPILLLDEATSALDSETERDVLTRLTRDTNKTLIIVSHRPAAFDFADVEANVCAEQSVVVRTIEES